MLNKKSMSAIFFAIVFILISCVFARPTNAFVFLSWADTKSGTSTLTSLSQQANTLNPIFTVYPGDVCDEGPDSTCFNKWQTAINGGGTNNLFSKTFASRGNHDNAGDFWVSRFDVAGTASRIGATNVSQLNTNLTFSFDYENSHFVAIDLPYGDVSSMDIAQIQWLDNDLTAAEGRGLTHAFIFFHGPIYPVNQHPDTPPAALVTALNKHCIVSATFHGHEHLMAYVHIASSRIAGITPPFEEFVTGAAGADLYSCSSGKSDWCNSIDGFALIDVSGSTFIVKIYEQGNTSPVKTYNFTKSQCSTLTPTPSPVIKRGDVNADGKINAQDLQLILISWLGNGSCGGFNCNLNGDAKVNALDVVIVLANFGK